MTDSKDRIGRIVATLGADADNLLQHVCKGIPRDQIRIPAPDHVSASIHTGFRQPREVMTARMLRGLSNPLVNTLNHPHGRKIGRRDGYEVDMQAVIEQAAASGCALELNATPNRLDLNGTWARRALRLGARFTVSSDAHSTNDLEYMQFGIGSARQSTMFMRME